MASFSKRTTDVSPGTAEAEPRPARPDEAAISDELLAHIRKNVRYPTSLLKQEGLTAVARFAMPNTGTAGVAYQLLSIVTKGLFDLASDWPDADERTLQKAAAAYAAAWSAPYASGNYPEVPLSASAEKEFPFDDVSYEGENPFSRAALLILNNTAYAYACEIALRTVGKSFIADFERGRVGCREASTAAYRVFSDDGSTLGAVNLRSHIPAGVHGTLFISDVPLALCTYRPGWFSGKLHEIPIVGNEIVLDFGLSQLVGETKVHDVYILAVLRDDKSEHSEPDVGYYDPVYIDMKRAGQKAWSVRKAVVVAACPKRHTKLQLTFILSELVYAWDFPDFIGPCLREDLCLPTSWLVSKRDLMISHLPDYGVSVASAISEAEYDEGHPIVPQAMRMLSRELDQLKGVTPSCSPATTAGEGTCEQDSHPEVDFDTVVPTPGA